MRWDFSHSYQVLSANSLACTITWSLSCSFSTARNFSIMATAAPTLSIDRVAEAQVSSTVTTLLSPSATMGRAKIPLNNVVTAGLSHQAVIIGKIAQQVADNMEAGEEKMLLSISLTSTPLSSKISLLRMLSLHLRTMEPLSLIILTVSWSPAYIQNQ